MAGEQEIAPQSGCCNSKMIIQLILFIIWTPLSIALIVVGGVYRDDCPTEQFIPVFMIVFGAFSLSYWILLPLECCLPTVRRILSILIALFMFAWFIAGSVWVFRIYGNPNRDCHNGMYYYVFSILIIIYIFILLGIIFGLLACLCCENSCATKICSYFQSCIDCCPCLACLKCDCLEKCLSCCKCLQCCSCLQNCSCLQSCCSCLQSCSCLDSCCGCLKSCSCLESCNCLQCLQCSDCSSCLQCCDCFKSLCCCCKNIQCSSCLNCNMCAQCCQCLQCCAAKA
ncbi:uncharacterized protein [Eleutherodactylus coqui]|uniref:uncharacterized protein n=1 Tax=Eleutherodactylus coqui TaxID=57060 RepID=UPI00346336A3